MYNLLTVLMLALSISACTKDKATDECEQKMIAKFRLEFPDGGATDGCNYFLSLYERDGEKWFETTSPCVNASFIPFNCDSDPYCVIADSCDLLISDFKFIKKLATQN